MAFGVRLRVASWAAWNDGDDGVRLGGAVSARPALPMSLRRRVSAVGRRALEAAWAVIPDGEAPRLVLASRHGEYSRTFDLLTHLERDGEVSPADFSLAVHHALAGLLSIATGNREGHTAVAAGRDSFGYGLLEAATFVAERGVPAIVMYFDEPLPEDYAPVVEGDVDHAMAAAILLVPPSWLGGIDVEMRAEPPLGHGGAGMAEAFLGVVQRGGEAVVTGGRHDWRWRHVV
jgi:hypothetical protein